jgi:predicted MFS family arabinose efflux permease
MSLNAAMFQVGSALGGFFGGVLIAAGGYASLGLGLMGFGILAASLIWRPTPLAVLSRTLRPAAAD